MDYILFGTDARMHHLAKLLLKKGHRVLSWEGPEGARIEPITSPLEIGAPVRLVLPVSAKPDTVHRAITTLVPGSRIYGGNEPADEESRALLARRAIGWENLLSDDRYCRENAVPTAEGALYALIEETERCVAQSTIGIVGSGRVAQALIDLLLRLGTSPVVCARDPKARRALRKCGCTTVPLPLPEHKKERLKTVDVLVNTVPVAGIIGADFFESLRRGTPVLELASGRENIDLSAAGAGGHPVRFLPALPGKVAPHSAALALFHAITKTEKESPL